MKNYDIIIKNYGIVLQYNKENKTFHGHIDYMGKDKNKHCGNSFIAYINGKNQYVCAWDFPFLVPAYVNDKIYKATFGV